MLIKSFSQLPVLPTAQAKTCEDILFRRFALGIIRTRQELHHEITAIANRSTVVGQLVAASTTVKVIDILLSGFH